MINWQHSKISVINKSKMTSQVLEDPMRTQEHCSGTNGDSFGKMAFSQKQKKMGGGDKTQNKTKKQSSLHSGSTKGARR